MSVWISTWAAKLSTRYSRLHKVTITHLQPG
jgi:hypothetical protein